MEDLTPEKTVASIAWLLIILGLAPFVGLLLWPLIRHVEPLSATLPLKRGQFISRYFRTDLNEDYQVDLYWPKFPDRKTEVDLDWNVVDDTGALIQQGTYKDRTGAANTVGLGTYRSEGRRRQRIIVNIHQDVQGPDGQPTLQIGQPEVSLDIAEGYYPLAVLWAALLAGSGVITLAVLRMRKWGRDQAAP